MIDLLEIQVNNEQMYSRKAVANMITAYITAAVEDGLKEPNDITQMISGLYQWLDKDHGYASKNVRVTAIDESKDIQIITELLCLVGSNATIPTTIQTLGAQLSNTAIWHKRPSVELDAVKTCCELICELAKFTSLYEVQLTDGENGIKVQSLIELDPAIVTRMQQTMFVPPMVIKPIERKSAGDSPYASIPSHAISERIARHGMGINIRALNLAQSVGFILDIDSYEYEHPLEETDNELTPLQEFERVQNHQTKCNQALMIAADIDELGQELGEPLPIYFPWFYDSRGRTYPEAFHITPNGDAWEKANLLLAKKEHVEGDFGL